MSGLAVVLIAALTVLLLLRSRSRVSISRRSRLSGIRIPRWAYALAAFLVIGIAIYQWFPVEAVVGWLIQTFPKERYPLASFLEGPWGTYGVWGATGLIAFGVVWLVLSLMMPRAKNPLSADAQARVRAGATDIGAAEARRLLEKTRRPRRLALSLGAILFGLGVIGGVVYLLAPNNTLAFVLTVGPMVLGYVSAWILFDLSQRAKRLVGYGYLPCRVLYLAMIVVALYTTIKLVPWGAIV